MLAHARLAAAGWVRLVVPPLEVEIRARVAVREDPAKAGRAAGRDIVVWPHQPGGEECRFRGLVGPCKAQDSDASRLARIGDNEGHSKLPVTARRGAAAWLAASKAQRSRRSWHAPRPREQERFDAPRELVRREQLCAALLAHKREARSRPCLAS